MKYLNIIPKRTWPPVRLRASACIRNKGNVLLIYDPMYRGGCWTLPGGSVGYEETIIETAEREVFEETAIVTKIHSLWRIREIWEPDPDSVENIVPIRRSIEFILVGDFMSGHINIDEDPSPIPVDGIRRIKECRWVSMKGLSKSIDNFPIYPSELLGIFNNLCSDFIPLDSIILSPLDLRRK